LAVASIGRRHVTWSIGYDHLLVAGVVPVAPYNPCNTDDPLDIEYRVGDPTDEYSADVQLKQSTLEKIYDQRSQTKRMIGACTDCGLGPPCARGRVHMRVQEGVIERFTHLSNDPESGV